MIERGRLVCGVTLGLACALVASAAGAARASSPAQPAAAASAARSLQLAPCTLPGTAPPTRCGTFRVPEDPARPQGRQLDLHVVVLGATGAQRAPDPIVLFSGGPGEAATDGASFLDGTHAALRRTHDFVLIDSRGTGHSAPIVCAQLAGNVGAQGFLDSFMPAPAVAACRAQQNGRDLAQYRTDTTVDDAAAVLAALGYEKANLWGSSYGTRAALEFARRHPERVRTMALEGVVPPDARRPLTFARDADEALHATIAACRRDAACGAAFPQLDADLATAFASVTRQPARVELTDPGNGESYVLRLDRRGLAQTLRYMLYIPSAAVNIPLALHAAAGGNFAPVGEAAALFARLLGATGNGLYLSVTCAEDVPFIGEAEVAAATRDTFLGDFRIRAEQAACRAWNVPAMERAELAPVHSDVPTLLVSGERDPVTPVRWAAEAARTLPHALQVVVPGGGHGTEGMIGTGCIDQLYDALVERGSEQGLDTRCVQSMRPPPWALALPPDPVQLDARQRASLVGSYVAPGFEIVIEPIGERLRLAIPGEDSFLVVARSATRLELDGMPSSYAFEVVEQSGGRVTVLRAVGFTPEPVLLRRK